MRIAFIRAMPLLAVVAGVAVATCGPAAAAPSARFKSYELSGRQDAVSCMTLARCVTIGSAGGHGTVPPINNAHGERRGRPAAGRGVAVQRSAVVGGRRKCGPGWRGSMRSAA
jgi:hypothetical protein